MASGAPSSSTALQELQPRPVWVRHVQQRFGVGAQPNETLVLGKPYYPSAYEAVNGRRGYHQGMLNPRLNDEGDFTITFPNSAGEDGVLHRNRFQIMQKGKRIPQPGGTVLTMAGGNYRAGDEWLEVWEGEPPNGDLLFVGTPTKYSVNLQSITLTGYDALFTLKKQRETAAGFWVHSPRDAFEYYCSAWQTLLAEDFAPGPAIANATDSVVTTADGRISTIQANGVPAAGVVRLGPVSAAHTTARVLSAQTVPAGQGTAAPGRYQGLRMEARITFGALGDTIIVGLIDTVINGQSYVIIDGAGRITITWIDTVASGGANGTIVSTLAPLAPGTHTIAVEWRGRWAYHYVNGQLAGITPMPLGAANVCAFAQLGYTNGATATMDVDYLLYRQTKPYLLTGNDPGDYRLPGAPPPGGLLGSWYSDADLMALNSAAVATKLALNPTRVPVVRRVEVLAALNAGNPLPIGISAATGLSVRFTGAVYLDLDVTDRFVEGLFTGLVGTLTFYRVYIGKTRIGEEYVSGAGAYGPSLRTWLGGSLPGWYPIVIEFQWQGVTAGTYVLNWATSAGGAGAAMVPNTNLSTLGVYEKQVRFESHFDVLQQLQQTFGYQFTCVPKQLESGQFPGVVVPRIRVGRDTEKVLTTNEGTQLQDDVTVEETCDDFLGDGQGLADQKGSTQVTAEAYNFAELEQHMLTHTEYDSVADVSVQQLLYQRVRSLLALRGSGWEQLGAQPRGYRELLDAFPVTGALAEFAWGVGDGARVYVPELAVEDTSPRQLMGVQWPFVPDGKQAPTVQFRQRPRNLEGFMRDIRRGQLNSDRYYQRQLVQSDGSPGANNAAWGTDAFSRLAVVTDRQRLVQVVLEVIYKSDASSWNVEINGTNRFAITGVGRYDVTAWVEAPTFPTLTYMYAQLVGGTGTYNIVLRALAYV